MLFDAGRHHANLQRLPGQDLVCTLLVRDDIRNGKLTGQGRGCDALISHDRDRTWRRDRQYELVRFDYLREGGCWVDGQDDHVAALVLEDGRILSAYGQYLLGAAVLIRWAPDAGPIEADRGVGIGIEPERR